MSHGKFHSFELNKRAIVTWVNLYGSLLQWVTWVMGQFMRPICNFLHAMANLCYSLINGLLICRRLTITAKLLGIICIDIAV